MKRLFSLSFIAFTSLALNAQSASDTGFAQQKKSIDSLVRSIDNNQLLTHNLFTGELMYGAFRANCYYVVGSGTISKMECFFTDSTAGKKVLYFQDNVPVRINDKGQLYYYTGNNLLYPDGRPVKQYIAKDMIFFSQELYKMLVVLMD